MSTNDSRRLEQFLSLAWYESALRFIMTFIAKTSELLLAVGLVVSTTNFLTDGAILNTNPAAATAWAWVQSLALDSSLGISFYYVLQCLKQRDWVKFALYLALTILLALVAGAITNVDTFSHAIHTSMGNAMVRLGFDVKLLSTLRSVAVVGFVLMSRLKDVSFKDLYRSGEGEPVEPTSPSTAPSLPTSALTASTSEAARQHTLSIEDAALLFQALLQHRCEVHDAWPSAAPVPLAPPQAGVELHPLAQATSTHPSGAVPQGAPVEQSLASPIPAPPFQADTVPEPLTDSGESGDVELRAAVPQPASQLSPGAAPNSAAQQGTAAPVEREQRLEQAYQAR